MSEEAKSKFYIGKLVRCHHLKRPGLYIITGLTRNEDGYLVWVVKTLDGSTMENNRMHEDWMDEVSPLEELAAEAWEANTSE